ncbi:hypothetical protein [Chromobacterium subtsugae]|uniref:hypothetical protein n=1 Tax=Chromobacterium subtsugae TaxID=251747 RepID=UPI00064153AE|nr:hypothetical protein [Chromobacterium subtsugae]
MPTGISNLAHSVRKNSSTDTVSVSLGHAHQLVAAAIGYKTLASYQAAQADGGEPADLDLVRHVVLDYDLLGRRALELGISIQLPRLHQLLGAAFSERLPRAQLHDTYCKLEDVLRERVDQVVLDNGRVNSAMAEANYDGIDEVYFDFEVALEESAIGDPLVVDLDGHVDLGIDTERPYAGHRVNVESTLTLERLGLRCFGEPEVEVTNAALDYGWSDPDPEDEEDRPPVCSLTQAYAELLGLESQEVGSIVDVEPQVLDGNNGEIVYGYLLNFEGHASPEIAAKILARHGALQIEVGPGFFENVRDDDWPN